MPETARTTPLGERLRQQCAPAPLTIGHRGASGDHPENTLPAFRAAMQAGAQLIEFDFRPTADDELVVIHDETVDRTTDAARMLGRHATAVDGLRLDELSALDAGTWKGPTFAGTRIPTLEETLALLIEGGVVPLLEHKAGSARQLVGLLARLGLVGDVLVSSFDWPWLTELHAQEPGITIAALGERPMTDDDAFAGLVATGASLVHWHDRAITVEGMSWLRDRGYLVCTYTVNCDLAMVGAAALGIDAITTDRPARLLELTARGLLARRG